MKKLVNPFIYFSGGTTLGIGILIMAAMVLTAGLTGQTFRGILSYGIGNYPYWRLTLHMFGGWAAFSLLLYAAARIFSPSKVRLIDIAGNQALAKLPGLLMLLSCIFVKDELMQMLSGETPILPSATLQLTGIVGIIVLVWFFAWSWTGFSIAANMRGIKAVAIYIVCYILAETAGGLISMI